MPIVGSMMLAHCCPVGQSVGIAPRSQYWRQIPVLGAVNTQPEPGLQSAVGSHTSPTGVVPAGRHMTSAGLKYGMSIWHEKPDWQPVADSGSHVVEPLMQTPPTQVSPLGQSLSKTHAGAAVQTLEEQVSPAGQATPHAPQLAGSFCVSTHWPPQSTPEHDEAMHAPAMQASPGGQSSPHAPQLSGSLWRSTHWPPQSVPEHDEAMQAPAMQASPGRQTAPQAPQLFGSLWRSMHWLPQSVPEHDEAMQAPATQASPEGQTSPQAPQLAGSLWRSVHWLPQSVPEHVQLPLTQEPPEGQAWPQDPQLSGSLCVSTHALPQVVCVHAGVQAPPAQTWPAGHSAFDVHAAGATQAPATHASPDGQTSPQAPQLLASLCRSTHALPQVVCVHAGVQAPPAQTWPAGHSAFDVHAAGATQAPATQASPDGQSSPQAPQLLGSLWRSTHALPQVVCVHVEGASQAPPVQTWPAAHWASVAQAVAHVPAAQTSPLGQSVWTLHEMDWCSSPMGMSPLLQAPDAASASSARNEREGLRSEAVKALMEGFPRGWGGRGAGPRLDVPEGSCLGDGRPPADP